MAAGFYSPAADMQDEDQGDRHMLCFSLTEDEQLI